MGVVGKAFYHYGYFAASRPCTAIFIGLVINAVAMVGVINWQSTADPQKLWVPPASRANVEQSYFAKEFGFFFRINTGWITPLHEDQADHDIFDKPYLSLLYELQLAIETGIAHINGLTVDFNEFCYKPISGQGCLVESPMQYWKMNETAMLNDTSVKVTSQCIPPEDATERICFDRIGTPVLTYAIFGGMSCEPGTKGECDACQIKASGM
jgi:Niemann-Pick C1 protein